MSHCHAKSENAARMLIAAGGHTVVIYGTWGEDKTKKGQIFMIQKKKSSFGNLYSNVDFLIITTNLGVLAAMPMGNVCRNFLHCFVL